MTTENNDMDFLNMSDEDILKHGYPPEVSEKKEEEESTETEDKAENVETEQKEDTPEEDADEKDADSYEAGEESNEAEKPEAEKKEESTVDYETEYKKVFAPFKANGKEVQVTSAEEAIQLMQMGANYNKKMAALKPNLKVLKLLETHGLLDESELNFLIDLKEKNPQAIMKLVKDSGIDPLEMDIDKAEGYKPNARSVNEKEMALDEVISELQGTEGYNRTITIVGTQWDDASRQVVAANPQLLKIIHTHVETGVYGIIEKEMDRQRMLGKLNGLSDIEAYRQVGDAIQARGGFDHLGRQDTKTSQKPTVVTPKPRKEDDPKLREKKLAAGTPKSKPAPSKQTDFNPLGLSDEEFSKLSPKFV